MKWDDLRIVAAVRDAGSYAGAGARLRIDETTVARRLARLQRTLGVRLFDQIDGVRRPTAHGERVLAHIQAMARHAGEIGTVGAAATGPAGHFRIAATGAIADAILSPRLGELLGFNPGLSVQFLAAAANVNFSRWEADLAIRLRKPDKGDFTISRLAAIGFCLVEPAVAPAHAPVVCAYPESLDPTPESRFLAAKGLQAGARCITDDPRVIRNLVRTRRAIGVLPDYLCAELQADKRLRVTPLPARREAWLLVQNHLARDAGARRVVAWIRDCFRAVAPAA